MKENMIQTLIIWLLLIMLSSCSPQPTATLDPMESQFSTKVPTTNMNHILELKVDNSEQRFVSGSRIRVIIQNKSYNRIFFAEDTFMRLLMFRDGKWAEVKNEITYSGSITLSPQGTPLLDSQYTLVKPALGEILESNAQNQLKLRIVVTGEIMKNDVQTGELVGAYVDVDVSP